MDSKKCQTLIQALSPTCKCLLKRYSLRQTESCEAFTLQILTTRFQEWSVWSSILSVLKNNLWNPIKSSWNSLFTTSKTIRKVMKCGNQWATLVILGKGFLLTRVRRKGWNRAHFCQWGIMSLDIEKHSTDLLLIRIKCRTKHAKVEKWHHLWTKIQLTLQVC